MSDKKISNLITSLLQKMNKDKNIQGLNYKTDLIDSGIIDSMDLVNLILTIEQKTGVILDLDDEEFCQSKDQKIYITIEKISKFILKNTYEKS